MKEQMARTESTKIKSIKKEKSSQHVKYFLKRPVPKEFDKEKINKKHSTLPLSWTLDILLLS